jgi:predicted permease
MLNDLRYAFRWLGRNRAFAALSVLCLALGIGANTAVFALLDAALLRNLPVPEPERLMLVEAVPSGPGGSTFSYPSFQQLREQSAAVADVFAYARADLNISAEGVTDAPTGLAVSDNYFAAVRVQPEIGRAFVSPDEPVVVLSDRYWRTRFRSDTAVIGRSLTVNGLPFTVAGVLPRRFFGKEVGRSPDVFVPLSLRDSISPGGPRLRQPNAFWLGLMARLKPGVSREQASEQFQEVHRRYVDGLGGTVSPGLRRFLERRRVTLAPGGRGALGLGEQFGGPLRILMTTAGVVLVIACANLAGLLLARGITRRREIAIRLALGAARLRLMRQLLVESAVLSAAGGGVGLLVGVSSANALAAVLSERVLEVALDRRILAFALLTSALTTVLFGVLPAMRAARLDLTPGLKASVTSARSGRPIGRFLIPGQVALTLVLLMGAGLFVRSLAYLRTMDAGFRGDHVVLVTVDPSLNRYTPERLDAFYTDLLGRAASLPGVQSAAIADKPLVAGAFIDGLSIDGAADTVEVSLKIVTPRFFDTMGIRLLAGRDFTTADAGASPRVAIVNETVARRYFQGRSAIGARIGVLGGGAEIVGVIADTKYRDLHAAAPDTVYVAMAQTRTVGAERTLHVRAASNTDDVIPALRDQVRALDTALPAKIRRFTDVVDANLERERLTAALSAAFGALGLMLTATGLFGLIAHSVERRTREIGIRISLGAQRVSVIWMVLRECVVVVAAGIAVGIPVSLWMSEVVRAQLFGVSPYDPVSAFVAAAGVVLVALLAAYVPARRASRVDPIVALRQE